MREALRNVRVIDLTDAMAGPFGTMILCDMGAEVIKVEHPDGGNGTRNSPRSFHPDDKEKLMGGYFNTVNRNKKSIAVDLKSPEGTQVVKDLAKDADVFIESYRRGVSSRLGIDYESIQEVNPSIIYASISGFGDPITHESPYSQKPSYDIIAQAMGGANYLTSSEPGGPPTKIGPGIGDFVPGMFAALGILTALWHREETGEGQYVDVAMYDAIMALCHRSIWRYSYRGEIEEAHGPTNPLFAPFGIFEAKDGHIAIAASSEHLWENLCQEMDRDDLLEVPEFEDSYTRRDNFELLKTEIEKWTTQHEKQEIFEMISDSVPCGPVNNAKDMFEDPHPISRDMFGEIEQPLGDGETATVELANTPIKLSKTPGGVERRGPLLGEHTDELLEEIGYSQSTIDELYAQDVITPKPQKG